MTRPEDIWRDLCEKDDRTSPEEYPDMALVTEDELVSMLQQYGDERAAGEREARQRCEDALRKKDAAMGVLFERLRAAGIDCSDLFS